MGKLVYSVKSSNTLSGSGNMLLGPLQTTSGNTLRGQETLEDLRKQLLGVSGVPRDS